MCGCSQYDISKVGTYTFGPVTIEVIGATTMYADFMSTIFDFAAIKELLARKDFSILYDGMYGGKRWFFCVVTCIFVFCSR